MVFLKHTLISNSMLTQDSIQTRFSGDSLPTTIPDLNPSVANFSDLVTMQKHTGDTIFAGLDHSVIFTPFTGAAGDGSIHLAFDESHWVGCVNECSMAGIRGNVNPLID